MTWMGKLTQKANTPEFRKAFSVPAKRERSAVGCVVYMQKYAHHDVNYMSIQLWCNITKKQRYTYPNVVRSTYIQWKTKHRKWFNSRYIFVHIYVYIIWNNIKIISNYINRNFRSRIYIHIYVYVRTCKHMYIYMWKIDTDSSMPYMVLSSSTMISLCKHA